MNDNPQYGQVLLTHLRDALELAGVIPTQFRPSDEDYTTDGHLIEALDQLRAHGWIVQPAPVPGPTPEPLP